MTTATGTARVELRTPGGWVPVCDRDRLTPGRGVAVLLPDGSQAAVFTDRRGALYAVANRDPFTGAYVLSRGLLGSTPRAGCTSPPRCSSSASTSAPASAWTTRRSP